MPFLIDTCLWIDFTRKRSPSTLKQFIAPYILDPNAHLAHPISFEILRHASPAESKQLEEQFLTFPILETPADLWMQACKLGQACQKKNIMVGSFDLIIATITIHHDAELISFDDDFLKIASISPLKVKHLKRPS
jgi:predicted nucleic acid-binding protein